MAPHDYILIVALAVIGLVHLIAALASRESRAERAPRPHAAQTTRLAGRQAPTR